MQRRLFRVLPAFVLVGALSACGTSSATEPTPAGTEVPGFDRALDHVVSPGGPDGGTLRLVSTRECADWMPADAWTPWCINMQRLVTRQLMTYGADTGRRGSVVVPDLALGGGVPNEDRTEWTYRLKPDVRWEDGAPITVQEVVQGIERLDFLRRDISIVDIALGPDDAVSVRLREARTDFDALLALPASAPLPESGAFMASGPFRIASRGSTTVFERNSQWDPATDDVRRPRVDRVEFTVLASDAEVSKSLATGAADLAIQGRMDAAVADRVMAEPAFAERSDNPGTGRTVMLAVPANAAPQLRQVECRKAVYSAVDRLAVARVMAADVEPSELAAEPATSLSPPTIASFDWSYQPFAVGDGSGDVDAARDSLARCGAASGFALNLVFADTTTNALIVDVISGALARVGIIVNAKPVAPVDYLALTASPTAMQVAGADVALLVQSPALSGVWGFWNPLVNGDLVGLGLSTNVAQTRIPAVDILLGSTEITSPEPAVQENIGRMIDRLVLDSATYIPLAYAKALLHRPSVLTNVTTNGALGNGYDLVNIGVHRTP